MASRLELEVCVDVLMGSMRLELGRVEAGARVLALERFEEVAGTEGLMRMDEGAVGSLFDVDGLSLVRRAECEQGGGVA